MGEKTTDKASGGDVAASDRRSHERFAVAGVRGSFLLSTDARVLNLSVDGMALQTFNPLKVGREYSLKLNQGVSTIPLAGRVVWCTLVRTEPNEAGDITPVYQAGVHFERLLSGRAAELLQFIENNSVVSLEKRLFGRFRLEADRAANVDCEAEFLVKELSLAGMLIQTDLLIPVDTEHTMEVRLAERTFSTAVRVVRSEEAEHTDDGTGPYLLGVEFLDLGDDARETLQGLIDAESQ